MGCCHSKEPGYDDMSGAAVVSDSGGATGAHSSADAAMSGYQTGPVPVQLSSTPIGGSAPTAIPATHKSSGGGESGGVMMSPPNPYFKPAKDRYDSQPDPLADLTTRFEHKSRFCAWSIRHPTVMTTNHTVKRYRNSSAAAVTTATASAAAGAETPRTSAAVASATAAISAADNPFVAVATGTAVLSQSAAAKAASDPSTFDNELHVWTVRLKVAAKTFVDAQLSVCVEWIDHATWKQHKSEPERLEPADGETDLYECYGTVLCRKRSRIIYFPDAMLTATYQYPVATVASSPDPDTRALPQVLLFCINSAEWGDGSVGSPTASKSAAAAQ